MINWPSRNWTRLEDMKTGLYEGTCAKVGSNIFVFEGDIKYSPNEKVKNWMERIKNLENGTLDQPKVNFSPEVLTKNQ